MYTFYFYLFAERRKSNEDENGRDRNDVSSADASTSEEKQKLKPFMADVTVYFHDVTQEEVKKLTRYLFAYPLQKKNKFLCGTTYELKLF